MNILHQQPYTPWTPTLYEVLRRPKRPYYNPALDPAMAFRFLDLPAEMRNIIYKKVLHHNRSEERQANPAILRTCREIHKEASCLLYSDSTLTVNATFIPYINVFGRIREEQRFAWTRENEEWWDYSQRSDLEKLEMQECGISPPKEPCGYEPPTSCELDELRSDRDHSLGAESPYLRSACMSLIEGDINWRTATLSAGAMRSKWPKRLWNISGLVLNITARIDPVFGQRLGLFDELTALNYFLYSLTSRLREGTKPQTVNISLRFLDRAGTGFADVPEEIKNILYPISKIQYSMSAYSLVSSPGVGPIVREMIRTPLKKQPFVLFDILREVRMLQPAMMAFLRSVYADGPPKKGTIEAGVFRLMVRIKRIPERKRGQLYDENYETILFELLSVVKACLLPKPKGLILCDIWRARLAMMLSHATPRKRGKMQWWQSTSDGL